ncbi:MAG: hypothetical protein JW388_0773 [Nitrospira sp.]|nr:hypothetical protein [Nitrospira sp.]
MEQAHDFVVAAFIQDALGHFALPDVRVSEAIDQLGGGELGKIHVGLRSAGDGLALFVACPNNAPDAAVFAIDPFGISASVLVTRIFVVPIGNPKGAIGSHLLADGAEPAIVGAHEILFEGTFEGAAVGCERVLMNGVVVNVAAENRAEMFRGPLVAEIDLNATVSSHFVAVIDDAGQELIGVLELRLATLTNINAARGHVKHVVDDAGAEKGVADTVEIHAPRIAGAIGVNFKFLCLDIESRNGSIHPHGVALGNIGIGDVGMSENSVGHVELAIGSPSESIQEFVTIFKSESGHENGRFIGAVVAIGVTQMKQMRRLAYIGAAIAE